MFRVVTYNFWHGLSPDGFLLFGEMEPATRRLERQSLQLELLQSLKAQVIFLQEVNPVQSRSKQLSESLKLQVQYHRDNAGMKLGRLGFPLNLDSGLCTLLDDSQHIEWTKSIRLSGAARSFVKNPVSFQWSESRSALFVSTYNGQFGRTLWVNTHLHHGIEMSAEIISQLADIRREGLISENVELELKDRLFKADQRRRLEVKTLLGELESLQSRYNLIVLGGDLNASPKSETIEALINFGFQSLTGEDVTAEAPTWDPPQNWSNHVLSKDFIPALLLDDLSFNTKVVERLHSMAQAWEARPRKIDYLLGWTPNSRIERAASRVFGQETATQLAPSDHFGLQSDFSIK
jgi:endonuclease/exonuclease/phosphatase family metal-dependent hydrolase